MRMPVSDQRMNVRHRGERLQIRWGGPRLDRGRVADGKDDGGGAAASATTPQSIESAASRIDGGFG